MAVESQPGAVAGVREFQAHHITVLHRGSISSVLGVDLESGVRIGQPCASCHRTGDTKKDDNDLPSFTIPVKQAGNEIKKYLQLRGCN